MEFKLNDDDQKKIRELARKIHDNGKISDAMKKMSDREAEAGNPAKDKPETDSPRISPLQGLVIPPLIPFRKKK